MGQKANFEDGPRCLFCKNNGEPTAKLPLPSNGPDVIIKMEPEEIHEENVEIPIHLSPSNRTEQFILKGQLKSIFILQKLFKINNEKLEWLLRYDDGKINPDSWFSLCISCSKIVDECFCIYKEIIRWNKKLEKRKQTLQDLIHQSQLGCQKVKGRKRKKIREDTIFADMIRSTIEAEDTAEPINDANFSMLEMKATSLPKDEHIRKQTGESEESFSTHAASSNIVRRKFRTTNTDNISERGASTEHFIPGNKNESSTRQEYFNEDGSEKVDKVVDLEDPFHDDRANVLGLNQDPLLSSSELGVNLDDTFKSCDVKNSSYVPIELHDGFDDNFELANSPSIHNDEEDEWQPTKRKKRRTNKSLMQKLTGSSEKRPRGRPKKKRLEIAEEGSSEKKPRGRPKKQRLAIALQNPSTPTKIESEVSEKQQKQSRRNINNLSGPECMQACKECKAQFYRKEKLDEHYQVMHVGGLGIECPECGCYVLKSTFRIHKKYHRSKAKGRTKSYSSEIRQRRRQMIKYREISEAFHKIPYYCDHCPLILTSPSKLAQHFETFHKGKELLPCDVCPKVLESKQLLKLHRKIDHPNECSPDELIFEDFPEPKTCNYCSLAFPSQYKMDYHIALFHREHLYKCTECSWKTRSYDCLLSHVKGVHRAASNRYVCELCSRAFKADISFNNHRRAEHYKELGLEPFKCDQCEQTLGNEKLLIRHIHHVHGRKKEFFCEFCPKAFAWERDLAQHLLLHTAPKEKQYKPGPFFCEFCNAKFNVRQGLYYHLKNHHSDKYHYRCDKCGMGYFFQRTLQAHQKKCLSESKKSTSLKLKEEDVDIFNV